MKFRRILIVSLLIISMTLTIKVILNYYHSVSAKMDKEKTIEALSKSFEDNIQQQDLKEVNTEYVIPVNIKTIENNKIVTNVVGRIVINKIGLDYPILEGATEDNLNISITRFYGSKVNTVGNCILAGHNMKDGSLFGKLKAIENGDSIILQDNSGIKKEYKVFSIKVIEPTDFSILFQDTNSNSWATLLTCTNNGKSRLVIVAKQI